MQFENREKIKLQIPLATFALLCGLTTVNAFASDGEKFSMRIMDVFSITGRGIVMTGKVESGTVRVGGAACIPLTSGETAARRVDGIEQFRKVIEQAEAGENVGILVSGVDDDDVARGEMLHGDCTPDAESSQE